MHPVHVIIRPVITEKSMSDASRGKFTFAVAKSASKKQIKKMIEEKFNVNIVALSTTIVKGRMKRVGTRRQEVPESVFKKAVVSLKQGQKIDLFELGS